MSFGALAPLPERLGGDAKRGRTAAQHARHCADLLALVRSSAVAVVTFHTGGTCLYYNGMHGVGLSHAPGITPNGLGDATLDWEPQYADDWDNSYPISIKHCRTSPALGVQRATWEIVEPNKVRVRTYNAAGGAVSGLVTLRVF